MYSKEELENAAYYPACGEDLLSPVLEFSRISLFIYVDWRNCRWSQTREEYLGRAAPANAENNYHQDGGDAVFPPCDRGELEERIDPAIVGATTDFGLKGRLIEMLHQRNERLGSNRLEYTGDRVVPFERVGAVGLDSIKEYRPTRFVMEPSEEESYRIAHGGACQEPWGTVATLSEGTGDTERSIRLLYFAGEAIATYCKLYASQGIAPRVLITKRTGWGGFAALEEPQGIMARLLDACEAKPGRWVRPDGDWEWSTGAGGWRETTRLRSEA